MIRKLGSGNAYLGKMDQALVSILIPFRNTEAFLTECLQSVREQDYKSWEVLAVDDHSDDGSWKLAELFALRDSRIRLLKNPGQGIIPALRTAYENSKGTLVTRMDSDDIMPPGKISHMAKSLLQSGPGHLATGKVRYFSIRGISAGYARYEAWLNGLTETGNNFSEIYKECPVPSPCWMAYRTDLEACGGFSEDRYPEDYDLCFRFYRSKLNVLPCQEVLHYWRDYDQRTSRTSPHYAHNYFLNIKLHYLLELDYDPARALVVWGAGTKGKHIAKALLSHGITFLWFCDNPRKIGKKIYSQELRHYDTLSKLTHPQSIITVANQNSQTAIRRYLENLGQFPMRDYFFFC